MTQFNDRHGKTWKLNMTLEDAWKIEEYDFRGKTEKVQLVPPSDDFFPQRISDPKVCFGMVWCLVEEQVQRHNENLQVARDKEHLQQLESGGKTLIEDELDFARRFDGEAIKNMKIALWEELTNFFPEMATTLKALTGRFSRLAEKANERLATEINDRLSDREVDRMIDEALEEAELKRLVKTG